MALTRIESEFVKNTFKAKSKSRQTATDKKNKNKKKCLLGDLKQKRANKKVMNEMIWKAQ